MSGLKAIAPSNSDSCQWYLETKAILFQDYSLFRILVGTPTYLHEQFERISFLVSLTTLHVASAWYRCGSRFRRRHRSVVSAYARDSALLCTDSISRRHIRKRLYGTNTCFVISLRPCHRVTSHVSCLYLGFRQCHYCRCYSYHNRYRHT